jgi:hypothetical protein
MFWGWQGAQPFPCQGPIACKTRVEGLMPNARYGVKNMPLVGYHVVQWGIMGPGLVAWLNPGLDTSNKGAGMPPGMLSCSLLAMVREPARPPSCGFRPVQPPLVFNTFQIANLVIYHYINGYDDVLLYVYIPLYHYINAAVFPLGFTRSTTMCLSHFNIV